MSFDSVECDAQRPSLRIGAYFSLSGNGLATSGPEAFDGFMFLVNKINTERIGPYSIDVIVCDDQFILSKALACFAKFAIEDRVEIVVGGHTTFTISAGDYFEKYQILNIQWVDVHFHGRATHPTDARCVGGNRCCTGPETIYTSTRRKWM